ncbi:hypothetical protein D0Y65_037033 [Glycine soja]|uniref:Uncharacterized protein n=1 Tax=Glycine soja TaxID=3848 RepID=A0A445HHI6_GLYSO|nr:hypothetical protein D0Y65_037033 [Glycine soja]RZB73099.1 hypothetical protein D0Y65_037033 [Glycine soja]
MTDFDGSTFFFRNSCSVHACLTSSSLPLILLSKQNSFVPPAACAAVLHQVYPHSHPSQVHGTRVLDLILQLSFAFPGVIEYVVEDADGELTGSDWSPPALPPEHVQQLKTLGLL